jgi:hypothetical protein
MALLTLEQFEQNLFNEFNNLTEDEFYFLIASVTYVLDKTSAEGNKIEFIKSIKNTCEQSKNISFKQWKALKAFISEYKKDKVRKQF